MATNTNANDESNGGEYIPTSYTDIGLQNLLSGDYDDILDTDVEIQRQLAGYHDDILDAGETTLVYEDDSAYYCIVDYWTLHELDIPEDDWQAVVEELYTPKVADHADGEYGDVAAEGYPLILDKNEIHLNMVPARSSASPPDAQNDIIDDLHDAGLYTDVDVQFAWSSGDVVRLHIVGLHQDAATVHVGNGQDIPAGEYAVVRETTLHGEEVHLTRQLSYELDCVIEDKGDDDE